MKTKIKLLILWNQWKDKWQTYATLVSLAVLGFWLMLKVEAFNDIPESVAELACVLLSVFLIRSVADKTIDQYFKRQYKDEFNSASSNVRVVVAAAVKIAYIFAAVIIFT